MTPLSKPAQTCHLSDQGLRCVCRIVITDLHGTFLAQVGGNGAQLIDGSFTEAAFNRPQGVAYSQKRDRLYVADTENHALREVSTLAMLPWSSEDHGQSTDFRFTCDLPCCSAAKYEFHEV